MPCVHLLNSIPIYIDSMGWQHELTYLWGPSRYEIDFCILKVHFYLQYWDTYPSLKWQHRKREAIVAEQKRKYCRNNWKFLGIL